jgi:hypothetical protein
MTLLHEIETYLKRTGMAAARFSTLAMGDPGFVMRLRKARECKERSVVRCREFMAANPNGVPKPKREAAPRLLKRKLPKRAPTKYNDGYKAPSPGFNRSHNRIDLSGVVIIDRTPCFNCGVRADIGCHHQPKSEPVRIV